MLFAKTRFNITPYARRPFCFTLGLYRGADKSLARPGSKQANKSTNIFYHLFRLTLAIFVHSSTKCRVFANITLLGQ
jgi:hypothetical protein